MCFLCIKINTHLNTRISFNPLFIADTRRSLIQIKFRSLLKTVYHSSTRRLKNIFLEKYDSRIQVNE